MGWGVAIGRSGGDGEVELVAELAAKLMSRHRPEVGFL
jgi:hypothetical protein